MGFGQVDETGTLAQGALAPNAGRGLHQESLHLVGADAGPLIDDQRRSSGHDGGSL